MNLDAGSLRGRAFNSLVGLDTVHNSLIDAFKLFNAECEERSQNDFLLLLFPSRVHRSNMLKGYSPPAALAALRPRMIEVNMLVEQLHIDAKNDFTEATKVIASLFKLHDKLGLSYKVKILDPQSIAT